MFWNSKSCINCDSKVKHEWSYCPNCGMGLKEDIKKEIQNDLKEIDKIFEMKVPRFVVKPNAKSKGVSIIITSDNLSPPKINVRTFGEKQDHRHHHHHVEKPVRIPKLTKEPETKIQRIHNKQVITLNLPDVKSLDDIEIKQLQQSIEIKAFAGDVAYFKLIPVPSNAIVNNEFKDGVLKIEILK